MEAYLNRHQDVILSNTIGDTNRMTQEYVRRVQRR